MKNKKIILGLLITLFVFNSACNLFSTKKKLETNIILEVSVESILRSVSGGNDNPSFLEAIDYANEKYYVDNEPYINIFAKAFDKIDPHAQLAAIFNTIELRDKIDFNSTNDEVLEVLRNEVDKRIDRIIDILRIRIDRYGIRNQNIQRIDGSDRILIELPAIENIERIRRLVTARAKLEFWETYNNPEVFPFLLQANEIIKEIEKEEEELKAKDSVSVTEAQIDERYPLFSVLSPSVNQSGQLIEGSVIGMAHYNDTSIVNEYLNMKQVRSIFPRDISFKWHVKPYKHDDTQSFYELHALKITSRDGKPPLDGGVVTDARSEFDQNTGSALVSMSMNADGAKIWARLTKNNV
ncbi:MAG TPA: hypothetical protein VK982_14290, partial [Bacteroidales bacterium]|nr:hypothetical protein [Bacteroidales bacterium]